MFRGEPTIPSSTRIVLYAVLTGVSVIGAVGLAVLRNPKRALEAKIQPHPSARATVEEPVLQINLQPSLQTNIETYSEPKIGIEDPSEKTMKETIIESQPAFQKPRSNFAQQPIKVNKSEVKVSGTDQISPLKAFRTFFKIYYEYE